jgi:hypothetical protein
MNTTASLQKHARLMVIAQNHITLNAQNSHIANSFDQANQALIGLMKAGLTVERLAIEGVRPEIHLVYSPDIDDLVKQYCTISNHIRDGVNIHRGIYMDCLIEWQAHESLKN